MTKQKAAGAGVFDQAKRRMALYRQEVGREPWKQEHDEAMKCLSFEATLACGVRLYDLCIELDEAFRDVALRAGDSAEEKKRLLEASRKLFAWWLRPCEQVERELANFERKGYIVEHGQDFRKRHAEAVWMLKPAAEAFNHDRMVDARDAAIDALRAGTIEGAEQ